jgi:RNA polymerase sigma-70 factor (ECF subfamily)
MTSADAEHLTRPSLLARLRDAADAESWQTFVHTYAPLVFRYARHRGVQDADAADITQDVLVRVARSMRAFAYQPERGRFRDWLGTVTRNQLSSFLARRQRTERVGASDRPSEVEEAAAPEADSEWTAAFHAQVLAVALERIRPGFEAVTWDAFLRVWQAGRPALDVAQELGLPIDKVYAAKARVLKRLREEILLLADDLPQQGMS